MSSGSHGTYLLVAWNVERYTSAVHAWLKHFLMEHTPAVVFLSETKRSKDKLEKSLSEFEDYNFITNVHKPSHYHGVAMLVRQGIRFTHTPATLSVPVRSDNVSGDPACGRVISVLVDDKYRLVGTYVPHFGRSAKDAKADYRINQWDPVLQEYLDECAKTHPTVWFGDINVALTEQDVSEPKKMKRWGGFTEAERKNFAKFFAGDRWIDVWRKAHPYEKLYSWRGKDLQDNSIYGMRLDNIVVSAGLEPQVTEAFMVNTCPLSDHVPVCARMTK